jgi:DUF1680 family protein
MEIIPVPFNKLKAIPFNEVQITDTFWATRQKINREVSIYLQHEELEKDHHIDNFRVATGVKKGTQRGEFYYDSDLYKWLEAACYILQLYKDEKLEKKVDEIVSLIKNAQTEEGYVNTFYLTKFVQKRFSNILFMHELYCAGHLIQAAIAHFKATRSKILLDVASKFADLIVEMFLKRNRKEAPGHEEIELALMELYHVSNNRQYFDLAKDFIDRRGKSAHSILYILKKFLNLTSTAKHAKRINQEIVFDPDDDVSSTIVQNEIKEFYSNLSLSERIKFYGALLSGKCSQNNGTSWTCRKSYLLVLWNS